MAARLLDERLYPTIKSNVLKNKNRVNALFQTIYNKNYATLTSIAPMKIILFTPEYKEELLRISGVSFEEIREIIKESADIKADAGNVKPITILLSCIVKAAVESKDTKLINSAMMIFCFYYYPLVYTKYFKHDPNEGIMRYVVSNMSNKFKLRQQGSVFAALFEMGEVCVNNNGHRFKKGGDKEIVFYILDLRNRMNDFFKNIFNAFLEAHRNQKYIQLDEDNLNDDEYHETDNASLAVQRHTNGITMKLASIGLDYDACDYAAKIGTIPTAQLRNYMREFIDCDDKTKMPNTKSVIEGVLSVYIFEGGKENALHSMSFFMEALKIYRRTGGDDNIVAIQNGINNIINKYTSIGKKVKRPGSLNNYKRAVFVYLILMIQKHN